MHTLFVIILVTVCGFAKAEPTANEIVAEVTDNVAMEYAECSAYFSIVSGAFKSSVEATKFKETSDQAAIFSLETAKQSRNESMATKVTLARIEMSLKDMQKTIDNNYSNISLLSNKYLTPCVDVMRDSSAMIQRWTQKIQSKYGKEGKSKSH